MRHGPTALRVVFSASCVALVIGCGGGQPGADVPRSDAVIEGSADVSHDAIADTGIADASMLDAGADVSVDDATTDTNPLDASNDTGSTDTGTADAGIVSSILVPRNGAWWGAMTNPRTGESQASAFMRFETNERRMLDIAHAYKAGTQAFPNATEQAWAAGGRILLINWKPSTTSWGDVANGSLDATVVNPAADRIRAFGRPMFLVLWHEPEDQLRDGFDTAANYVAMWRHVHDVFAARGVTNVVWVWNMMGYVSHAARWTPLYPGDAYVDWLGADPYTFSSQTFDQATQSFYDWAMANHPDKPIMYCEYGPSNVMNSYTPTHEATWIRSVLTSLQTTRRSVRAVVYWENEDPAWDTRDGIDTSTTYLDAFRAVAADPFFNQPH